MKTLNIYCGIRSIGWNVIEAGQVIDFGVKRVNVDFDSYYAFIGGLPVAKRIDRRMKRQARRNLWRYKTRRDKLEKLLKTDGMYPTQQHFRMSRQDLNNLRASLCVQKVASEYRQDIGRALLDLQAKRGYKSMRGVDDTGDSEYLETIAKHEEALKAYPTVGAYLASLDTCKNVILRRETYEAEYRRICEVQGIDPERYWGAIFRQRPLKKGKIAYCKLEPNRKVTHQSNPLYQQLRVLRDVHNIEIFDAENNAIDITSEHRSAFIRHLQSGKDLTKAGALKIMSIKKPKAYTWYSGKAIAGDVWGTLNIDVDTPKYDLWQDLISATDDNLLIEILKQKYNFSHEKAIAVAGYDLKGLGYSDYSEKAIKKLLPEMGAGKTLKEATLDVYGKVDFNSGVALRNVVLEQVHASCASLVSAIKKKHDVGELQIEIDSLLKMGNKARKARASGNRKQEKENAELDKRIAEAGGEPSDYNRKKLRLWDEMNGCCPYFPDEEIPLAKLFTDEYNLDHVVPKSKLFEFSENNLVLCPKADNKKKLRTTGADFVAATGKWEQYVEFVNASKINERKKALLLMKEADIPVDYVSRNAGTDYNTRCFLALHPNSRCLPNKLINMYAKSWYGSPYDENDVRHVLVKAFTIANMNEQTIDYFDHIKEQTKEQTSAGAYDLQMEIPLPDLSNIPVYCPKVKFFRRTKVGYIARFSLHKESVYGQRKRAYRDAKGNLKEEIFYKIRQPVGKLTPKMVKNISDAAIRRLVEARIAQHKGHIEAIQSLTETPVLFNGQPVKSVSVNVYGDSMVPLHSTAGDGRTGKLSAHERKVDYVYNSMNYGLKIVEGKKVVLPLLQAVRNLNEGVFDNAGLHKGDRVLYDGRQYFVSGIDDAKVTLRDVYTLLAEQTLTLNRAEAISKIEKQHIPQL
jgi:hypothetical protein